jgi:hypothetical protein
MSIVRKTSHQRAATSKPNYDGDDSRHHAALHCVDDLRKIITDDLGAALESHGLHGLAGRLGLAIHRVGEACTRNSAVRTLDTEPLGLLQCDIHQFLAVHGGGVRGVTLTPLGWRIHTIVDAFLATTMDTLPSRANLDRIDLECIKSAIIQTEAFWARQKLQ